MKTRQERIENIRKVLKTADEDSSVPNSYTIKHWRGKSLHRKVIAIDVEYLMFRLENSRTEIQQLAYMRKHSLPSDFFKDPESLKAQEAQEEILVEMVRGKGKELLDDLKTRKQGDPCIITYDGYIVNGNRRTAALKLLGERYIDCVVLPTDAFPKDIYALEQQLQIAKDFKENYHWINELRNIRRGLTDQTLEFKEEEIAENLRLELPDLRVKKRMIDLIDSFLEWKKIPGQFDYPKLDDTEEIFRQLEKGIKKYKNEPAKMKALQNAVFNLIEEKPSEGRLYSYVTYLIKTFDQAYQKLQSATQSTQESTTGTTPNGNQSGDILGEVLGSDASVEQLDDPSNAKNTSSSLVDIIADVKAENKEKQDSETVFNEVSNALRSLQGLTIDGETAKLGGIKNKLEQIISSASRLLEEIKPFDK